MRRLKTLDEPHIRKLRILILSRNLWRKRLVFWFGAISVGVVASYFALLADWAQATFANIQKIAPWSPLILCPLAFGLSSFFTIRFFPAAPGSGIPQAIAARITRDKKSRQYLIGAKVAIGKILLTTLALLAGASIGREGPTVQVGAAIMLLCAGFGGLSAQRGIVLAGASAGVAAAFNTPLAGIVFAIEEMARAFEHRNSSMVLAAIVFSGAAAMSISGNYNYFGYLKADILFSRDWLTILVIGLAGGLLGGLFVHALIGGNRKLRAAFGGFGEKKPVSFAVLCGLIFAGLGLLGGQSVFGSGYALGHGLLHGTVTPEWWQTPAKFFATVICAISGIPGGIFSPSLSVGAALGGGMSEWFSFTPEASVVLLSMVAYFAGVTQAPITAFVIVLEITGKASSALPLIATALIAAAVGRLLSPISLYHILAKQFVVDARKYGQAETNKAEQ